MQWDNLMELQAKLVALETEIRGVRNASVAPAKRRHVESAAWAGIIVAGVELLKQIVALFAAP